MTKTVGILIYLSDSLGIDFRAGSQEGYAMRLTTRGRFAVTAMLDLPMPEIDLSDIPAAPPVMRRTVSPPASAGKP